MRYKFIKFYEDLRCSFSHFKRDMPPKRKAYKLDEDKPQVTTTRAVLSKRRKEAKTSKNSTAQGLDGANKEKDVLPAPYTYWLLKSEPDSRFENGIDMKFSFDDLKSSENKTSCWDGVRNYQARNFLRDQMKLGHDAFFYHSNCKEPGIVGHIKIVKEGYPDHTQFDPKDPHYDRTCTKENPKWYMVDVKYVRPLKRFISLAELKRLHQEHVKSGGPLKNLALFTKARLSVQPISQEEWDYIMQMEQSDKKC